MIRTFFLCGEYTKNWPCVSSQIRSHDVVGVSYGLKLRTGAMKGADAETLTGGLDLARRAENRGNLKNRGHKNWCHILIRALKSTFDNIIYVKPRP